MKKLYFPIYMAIPLLFMTACSSESDLPESGSQEQETVQSAVGFGASIAGQAEGTTRATVVDLEALCSGFGVFAYDQGTQKWATYSQTYVEPNFMKNQPVTSTDNGLTWIYSPLKYWPNTDDEKLSFFGYAPYESALSTTATTKNGLKLVLDEQYGGPAIQYTLPDDLSKTVDLCYAENSTSNKLQDLTKPTSNSEINFHFKHALSRLNFKVQVVNDVVRGADEHDVTGNNALAKGTTITIKKVELIGSFAKSGVLSLATGSWKADNDVNGNLTLDNSMFMDKIQDGITTDEAITEQNLLAMSKTSDYLTVIPGGKFLLQITYEVKTVDTANSKNTSTVTNVATTEDLLELKQGYAYEFHLHLGMTSVKMTADIEDWNKAAVNSTEINLPANLTTSTVTFTVPNPGTKQDPTNL